MGTTTDRPRRPRGSGSIQWRNGRPYAVFRDVITGRPTWVGFDTEEEADAFLTQWAADKKASRLASEAARAEQIARAPQHRSSASSEQWTFNQVLTDWEDRHRDGVQDSTMRDYGPALNDLRQALGGVLARSLTDEHFEAYKRAKLYGVDITGGGAPARKVSPATVNKRLDLARRVIREASRRGVMSGPNPVDEVVRPRSPKREQMVLSEPEITSRPAHRSTITSIARLPSRRRLTCRPEGTFHV